MIWPDQTYFRKPWLQDSLITLTYQSGLPKYDYSRFHKATNLAWTDQTAAAALDYKHVENPYIEFHREPLVPFSCGEDGPAAAIADINGDQRADVFFFGASKTYKPRYIYKLLMAVLNLSHSHLWKLIPSTKMWMQPLQMSTMTVMLTSLWQVGAMNTH